jgi:hypothetical protein
LKNLLGNAKREKQQCKKLDLHDFNEIKHALFFEAEIFLCFVYFSELILCHAQDGRQILKKKITLLDLLIKCLNKNRVSNRLKHNIV